MISIDYLSIILPFLPKDITKIIHHNYVNFTLLQWEKEHHQIFKPIKQQLLKSTTQINDKIQELMENGFNDLKWKDSFYVISQNKIVHFSFAINREETNWYLLHIYSETKP